MRVLALIDMDSFYTQVEVKRNPSLKDQPVVVIQYNPYGDLRTLKPHENRIFPESNGSIIAASYEARKFGVKRNMMAQAGKKLCPELQIVQVPVAHGKADLTIYREAGAQVINVLSSGAVCERASIDEAYLDVTAAAQQLMAAAAAAAAARDDSPQQEPQQGQINQQAVDLVVADGHDTTGANGCNSSSSSSGVLLPLPDSLEGWHVAGEESGSAGVSAWWQQPGKSQADQLLAAGAVVVARLRAAVADQLGYSCSAGIAHSKILAKLGAGLNKPAQQTLVPAAAVADLLNPLPIGKLRALGGKFGEEIATSLGIQTVGELAAVPVSRLESLVGEENAAWLARLAQGIDDLEVKPRTLPKSISCGKTFRGPNAITGLSAVHKWLQELGKELQERIEADRKDHQRLPGLLTVSIDTLPAGAATTAAAATGAAAAAAVAATVGSGAAAAVAASGGRHTAQTWRAGAVNVSRSCNLRRPVAEVMAEDALKLVKKWARDRGQGWKIIGMFISASNFVAAPTGASTLERFMAAAGQRQQQQQQQQQQQTGLEPITGSAEGQDRDADPAGSYIADHQAAAAAAAAAAAGSDAVGVQASTKRSAAAAGLSSDVIQPQQQGGSNSSSARGKKRAYGDLRGFLTTSTAAATAAGNDVRVGSVVQQKSMQEVMQQQGPEPPQNNAADGVAGDVVEVSGVQFTMPSRAATADSNTMTGPPPQQAIAAAAAAAAAAPTGRVKSALSSLSAMSSAAGNQAASGKQHQQQQQHLLMVQQPRHQQQVATEHEVLISPISGPYSNTAAAAAPAAVSGSQSQQSLPSQVVPSLGDWLDSQQQQQQHCSQQQQPDVDDFAFGAHILKEPEREQQEQQRPEATEVTGMHPAASEHQAAAADPASTTTQQQQQQQQQQQRLRMSDIDPAVLAELPYHIQMEIRQAAGERTALNSSSATTGAQRGKGRSGGSSHRQQHKVQQTGNIAKYFGRTK